VLPLNGPIVVWVFGAIDAFISLPLALFLFSLWNNSRAVQADINNESGQMLQLWQESAAFAQPDKGTLQKELRAYAHSVAYDEWPALCAQQPTLRGDAELADLESRLIVKKIPRNDSALRSAMMSRLARLDELRHNRQNAAMPVIIPEIWVTLLLISAVVLFGPVFFNIEHAVMQRANAILFATALGMVFFLAARLDYVFCGTSVSPQAFVDVSHTIEGH